MPDRKIPLVEPPLPRVAATRPCPVELRKGQTVHWCSCGLSQHQPFCDNSHLGTDFEPVPFTAQRNEIVFFCACKHSSTAMLCDGKSHQRA
ncbi:MAG TPA: CDGSH iron-sulfur domain-containing protein [Dongiaceae bacterium]|nr:CDGSH iron-sulfur domain-containing protein [Dongiaceae bacterium]